MSAIECARAILRYVSDKNTAIILVAIAGAESGWNLNAAGDKRNPGTCPPNWCREYCSWGPWQINICCHSGWIGAYIGSYDPCTIAQWLTADWSNSAWAAWKILTEHGGLYAWSVYKNGSYTAYLAEARAAVEAVLSEGGRPPGGGEQISNEERCIHAGGIWTGQECIFTPPPPLPITPLSFILVPITAALGSLSGAGLLFLWRKGMSISEAKDMLLRRIRHGR